ncbi:MAG: hypothetical protein ACTHN3_13385 [Solirubrobacterales bacterium]
MDEIGKFATLLGLGESIASLFGDSGPNMQELMAKLEFEIKEVFRTDLADAAVHQATGVAQAASDWLAIDYVNAVNAGETTAQLWNMLTGDSAAPRLSDLQATASEMIAWASDNPKAIAQQTLSLSLTVSSLIVTYHRERATNAPDKAAQGAETADMKSYAGNAVTRVKPLFDKVHAARLGGISQPNSSTGGDFHQAVVVTDSWYGYWGSADPIIIGGLAWGNEFGGPTFEDCQRQVSTAYDAYLELLNSGSDNDYNTLRTALQGDVFVGWSEGGNAPSGQDVIQNDLPGMKQSGQWYTQGQAALQGLTTIANG